MTTVRGWVALAALCCAAAPAGSGTPAFSAAEQAGRQLRAHIGGHQVVRARLDYIQWAANAQPLPPSALERRVLLRHVGQRLAADSSHEAFRARGLAALLAGDLDGAIAAWSHAAAGLRDRGPLVDLSGALLERWVSRQNPLDALRALDASERALRAPGGSPGAAFNRALALHALQLSRNADAAWDVARQRETAASWRRHLSDAERLSQWPSAPITSAAPSAEALTQLEREMLPRWAASVTAGTAVDLSPLLALSRAVVRAGGDPFAADDLERLSAGKPEDVLYLAQVVTLLEQWWRHYDASNYSAALDVTRRIADLVRPDSRLGVEGALRAAIVEVASGQTAAGLARLDRIAPKTCSARCRAVSSQLRGLAAMQGSRFDVALVEYAEAKRAAHAAFDEELEVLTSAYMATALAASGRLQDAWTELLKVSAKLESIRSVRRRFQLYWRSFVLAEEMSLPGASLAFADALSLDPYARVYPWLEAASHFMRARAHAGLGDAIAATKDLSTAARVAGRIEDVRHRAETLGEIGATAGRVLTEEYPREAIQHLTRALEVQHLRANQFGRVSLLSMRGKAYLRVPDRGAAERDLLAAADWAEREARAISGADGRASRVDARWDLFEQLISLQLDRPATALATLEHWRARELRAAVGAPEVASFTREWLRPDHVALVYLARHDDLLLWVIGAGRVRLVTVPVSSAELERAVRQASSDAQSGRPLERRLAKWLIPEDALPVDVRKLTIVPDSLFQGLPYAALPADDTGGVLIDRLAIRVAPSLIVAQKLDEVKVVHGMMRRALVIGVSRPNSLLKLPMLPFVHAEVRAVGSAYRESRVLLNPDSAILRRELETSDVFHFAGHALSNIERTGGAGLVLSDARTAIFSPDSLSAGSMKRGSVVVLSACDTARGASTRGEGVMALARGFLSAGASSVVATLWAINDIGPQHVVQEFHRYVAAGYPAADALAGAQRSARDRGVPNWAAFVVIGGY